MPYWPPSLIVELAERRAVLFLGAGLSVSAGLSTSSVVPDWAQLLEKLGRHLPRKKERDYVGKLIRKKLFLDAAQIVRDGVSAADFVAGLREEIPGTLRGHAGVYEHLLKLDPKIILTTNFDEYIEQQFLHYSGGNRAHSVCRYTQDHMLDDIRSPMRVIGKIHGCITEPGSAILTRRSYFEARRRFQTYFSIVESIVTVNTVIFLGYSFSDPDVSLILENVNLRTPSKHLHYALVPRFEHKSLRDAISSAHNINFVEYPVGEHANFENAIGELWQSVSQYRTDKGLI